LIELVDGTKVIGIVSLDREVFKACLGGREVPEIKEMSEFVRGLMNDE